MAVGPRRVMADVLLMPAFKFGNPVQISHLSENQQSFASSMLLSLASVSWVPPFLVGERMVPIVWQEYRVFTGVSLTRKMTTR
jgi:hypothetical protein